MSIPSGHRKTSRKLNWTNVDWWKGHSFSSPLKTIGWRAPKWWALQKVIPFKNGKCWYQVVRFPARYIGSWEILELSTKVSIYPICMEYWIYVECRSIFHTWSIWVIGKPKGSWSTQGTYYHLRLLKSPTHSRWTHTENPCHFLGRIWRSCNENPWPSLIISSLVFDFIQRKTWPGFLSWVSMDGSEGACVT